MKYQAHTRQLKRRRVVTPRTKIPPVNISEGGTVSFAVLLTVGRSFTDDLFFSSIKHVHFSEGGFSEGGATPGLT